MIAPTIVAIRIILTIIVMLRSVCGPNDRSNICSPLLEFACGMNHPLLKAFASTCKANWQVFVRRFQPGSYDAEYIRNACWELFVWIVACVKESKFGCSMAI